MRQLLYLIILLSPIFLYGQKISWTTYFPVESEVIGKIFSGKNPNDFKLTYNEDDVAYNSTSSASSFSMEQKRTAVFNLNTLFNKNNLRVYNINAWGVKVDRIDKEGLTIVAPNAQFVYAGLRADSATIVFRKVKSMTLSPNAIIDSLVKFYPKIKQTELGKFTDFLKFSTTSTDSLDFNITIKDPTVYFMVQIAKMQIYEKSSGEDWRKNCASFLGNNNRFVDSMTLANIDGDAKSHITGQTDVHFAKERRGARATLWLEISEDSKDLLLIYRKNIRAKEDTSKLTSRNNAYAYKEKNIFRYVYREDGDKVYSKEVLLTLEAVRRGNKIVVKSGATTGKQDGVCGKTYINYPESSLEWIEFRR